MRLGLDGSSGSARQLEATPPELHGVRIVAVFRTPDMV